MLHPSQYFTQEDVTRERDIILKSLAEHDRKLKAAEEQRKAHPRELPPIVYADVDAARLARINFEEQPDPRVKLRDLYERQNELFTLEAELLKIAETIPKMTRVDAEDVKRKIFGWEEPVRNELPGIARTFVHIEGQLEKTREKLNNIEKDLPRLKVMVAEYENIERSLRKWSWFRINRIREAELAQQSILNGKLVERRGEPTASARTVLTTSGSQ